MDAVRKGANHDNSRRQGQRRQGRPEAALCGSGSTLHRRKKTRDQVAVTVSRIRLPVACNSSSACALCCLANLAFGHCASM